jgi:lipopolysaccharide/colanic/teichoic acid biosynthesis glycosyltransferase
MRQGQIENREMAPPKTAGSPDVPLWAQGSPDNGSSHAHANVTGGGYPLKRLFDVLVVLAGLMISSPMWLIFSAAIKLEDRGQILFSQERWGKNQTKIQVYKFRTMVPNAIEKFGNIQAQENDPRVTKVGRFLRATSLDEMPQLLNILKGDMSWVGPRALPIDEVQVQGDDSDLPDDAIPGFEERAKLRPGLTGIAQIFAPRDVPRQQKYQYDALYTNSQSLWLDIRLIFLSLWITLRARWESRESKV